mmetsp:Transcript_5728/g.6561  ORF Transcript_5728/g.6561 Transcript_5728/m.6561 type:complete len:134 (-) Transcript_5728:339-740(-)|eukprot:CAMPEP_0197854046 /NCGR_PEP_ID=MMETSP1438-20131217/23950_1 /TAXON_ID=1461541 /ORGANISM="Pterosperma sp., Strain CCMP1384" /LENGTH=133 /DNA_ID=CAMNT_0043468675 /DNA_START=124 /DNA_END=525 /DNA_ORIENTATION=+
MASNHEQVAQAFIGQYYQVYDRPETRPQCINFFYPDAIYQQEKDKFEKHAQIAEILQRNTQSMGLLVHSAKTLDSQPTPANNGVLILVTGDLQMADQERPFKFSECFHLLEDPSQPPGNGQYRIYNFMFRHHG